jgi:hypothetical protein
LNRIYQAAMSLKDNLIKSMQNSAAWVALADALAVVVDQVVEPTLTRLKARPRLFDMHPDDVKVLFDELGANATIGRSDVQDRPLLLLQRLDEVHQKNYLYPLKKTLQREFSNVRVSWVPLFAPTNVETYPYGSVLAREVDKGLYQDVPADGWFKTSRGLLQINLEDLYRLYPNLAGADLMDRFVLDVDQVLMPLLPTRIVYDGQLFVLQVYLSDVLESLALKSIQLDVTMAPCVLPATNRLGVCRIGSVRIGDEYDFQERSLTASTQFDHDFGDLTVRRPLRLGDARIGEMRIGVNLMPADAKLQSLNIAVETDWLVNGRLTSGGTLSTSSRMYTT